MMKFANLRENRENGKRWESIELIGKLTAFFAASGVQLAQPNSGLSHFRRAAFSA
jgi:hypothetical protein